MGKRENTVETYFSDEVGKLGGFTRKWVSPGHSSVPDRIVFIPLGRSVMIWFVEVKTVDEAPNSGQSREIKRLKDIGCNVTWLAGHAAVDHFIQGIRWKIENNWRYEYGAEYGAHS